MIGAVTDIEYLALAVRVSHNSNDEVVLWIDATIVAGRERMVISRVVDRTP